MTTQKWHKQDPLVLNDESVSRYDDCLPLDLVIEVGIGESFLKLDDTIMYSEHDSGHVEGGFTVRLAESLAAADPDHDWQIVFSSWGSKSTYQRHDVDSWRLVKLEPGFA